jgi:uncharacterized protein (DUF2336 family)
MSTLIDELESAVAGEDISRRAHVLQRVTDLFVANSGQLSEAQIALFDDVMVRLLNEIDTKARAGFGELVAGMEITPAAVVRELALDDSIDVAGPILTRLEGIGADVLMEGAMTKSQDHLLAISRRRQLPGSLTDVLVERGDRRVAISTTANPGAELSEFGCATLVGRAEGDRDLAACIWRRPGIPRQHLLTLFAAASRAVQQELQSINPRQADEIKALVARARNDLHTRSRELSPRYPAARAVVESLRDAGKLSEAELWAFASAKKFDETLVALALMCDIPVALVEQAMTDEPYDQLLVLAKSVGLSFDTVKAIMSMRARTIVRPIPDLDDVGASFSKLRPETARKTLQFYRLRMRTVLN